MRHKLKTEVHSVLYQNLLVPKNWPLFFEAVKQAQFSIHLNNKSVSQPTQILTKNKDKSIKATSNHSNITNTSLSTNAW